MKIYKYIFILVVFMPVRVNALDTDECTKGRTVFIDEIFDKEATVIKNDYSDDTCYVRLTNGDTKWVKSSDLMGRFGKEVEDYLEEEALKFIGRCFFQDKC